MGYRPVHIALWAFVAVGALAHYAQGEGERTTGDKLDPTTYGPSVIESWDEVVARDRAAPPRQLSAKEDPSLRFGEWMIYTQRGAGRPHSGTLAIINKWGDIRIGIGFPETVDVDGAYFSGQGGPGVWPRALRVIGYRDNEEVARTGWFENIDEESRWFAMDLCGVDRIVILAKPSATEGAWYAMDDLTFTSQSVGLVTPTVIDFENLKYRQGISGTGYEGLSWEFGTGADLSDAVAPPRVPPGYLPEVAPPIAGAGNVVAGGLASLPELILDFEGIKRGDGGSFSFPPDTHGAIGTSHFVEVVNRAMAIYGKSNGALLSVVGLSSFLPPSGGDPRVLYDHHSNRWVIIKSEFDSGSRRIFLAVSLTNNPLGEWFKTSFLPAQGSDTGKYPDYPTLGIDANGIYIGAYMVGGSNRMTIFAIDKAPLLDVVPSLGTITAFRELPWQGAYQPAVTYGNPSAEYVVSRNSSSGIRVRRIDPPLTNPTMVDLGTIPVNGLFTPPNVPALGATTPLDSVGSRLMNSVFRNGSIWTTSTIDVGGQAAVRWYQLDPVAMSVVQFGTVIGSPWQYFMPSIAVNQFDDAVLGFSGAHANAFASAFYTGRRAVDPPGEMAAPQLLRAGNASQNLIDQFGRNRWGDYSFTSVDPTSDSLLWTVQEYSHSDSTWGTQVAVLNPGDCNGNGIRDECDVACGAPGTECDIPGCGLSDDCNENLRPDECDVTTAACCMPDGSCCDVLLGQNNCVAKIGVWYGSGTACADALDPACVPTDTRIELTLASPFASPGSAVPLEISVTSIGDLVAYQVSIQSTAVAGASVIAPLCPGGTTVDTNRSDFVFNDPNVFTTIATDNCDTAAIGAVVLSGGSVVVNANADYLGEYTLFVPPDALPGDIYEISVDLATAKTFFLNPVNEVLRYLPGATATINVVDEDDCLDPTVAAEGGRTIRITPQGFAPQALLVAGDATDPNVSCVSLYVQDDGTLGPNPVFKTTADWGDVGAYDDAIIPSTTYQVHAECSTANSAAIPVTMGVFGDLHSPPDGVANFADIFLAVQGFQGNFSVVTLERADIHPCTPNRVVNFGDIFLVVTAFQGKTYAETGCPMPCP